MVLGKPSRTATFGNFRVGDDQNIFRRGELPGNRAFMSIRPRGRPRKGTEIPREIKAIAAREDRNVIEDQNFCCAICSTPLKFPWRREGEELERACRDHNHKTGQLRGYLCKACNFMIGHAKENITILAAAIIYLQKWERPLKPETPKAARGENLLDQNDHGHQNQSDGSDNNRAVESKAHDAPPNRPA